MSEAEEPIADPNPKVESVRVVAVTVKQDGSFELHQSGIELWSIPGLLRVVAADVEKQLGIWHG